MVRASIEHNTLRLELCGLSKLWALQKQLEIPLGHVRAVGPGEALARAWWSGQGGPGLLGGTLHQDGKRIFWDVRDPGRAVVIDVEDERYEQLIVEVADPAMAVKQISAAISPVGE